MFGAKIILLACGLTLTDAMTLGRNLTQLQALTVMNCGQSLFPPSSPDRIIGGEDAKAGEYPWMVSLRERSSLGFEHVCGAAILNENWVVTAAHCFDYTSASMYEIFVGLHKLSRERDANVKLHKIDQIIPHPDYDDGTLENDIALIKTTNPIDISGSNGYVNGICLPKTEIDPTGYATVTGWGHEWTDGYNSDTLQAVSVPIIPRDLCNESYDEDLSDGVDQVTETMICAGSKGRDSCQNDSGGPLIQYDKKGTATLIGVVSHGIGCGKKYYPGVYTKVAPFVDWMTRNTL